MRRRPPRSTRFPSTTLFRSPAGRVAKSQRPKPPAPRRRRPSLETIRKAWLASEELATPRAAEGLGDVWADLAAFLLLVPCRSEEHTSELQSRQYLVCRLLLE